MLVLINEREVGALAAGPATVGEVVEAMRVHVDPAEILTAVEIDGVALSAGEEERWSRRAAAAVERLVLRTETAAGFVEVRQRDLASSAVAIAVRLADVAARFRAGDDRDANAILAVLMEELRLGLLLAEQLAIIAGGPVPGIGEPLQPIVTGLIAAQEAKDWPRLAALLDEQLVPLLGTWSVELAGDQAS
jgi:hypothetical protein